MLSVFHLYFSHSMSVDQHDSIQMNTLHVTYRGRHSCLSIVKCESDDEDNLNNPIASLQN